MARGVPNNPAPAATTSVSPSRLQITSVTELWDLAQLLFKGGAAAMQNVDRPEKVFTIIMHGLEVGLAPTQALANIMMQPNGRCSIWGDGALALVRASGQLAKHVPETLAGEGDDRTATCVVQRVNEPERAFTFSMREAKAAGLIQRSLGKDGRGTGPWVTYPDRMLKMRARGFALRDVFPDVLKGLVTAEEAQDALAAEAPRVVQVDAAPAALPAPALSAAPPPAAGPPVELGPTDLLMSAEQLTQIADIKKGLVASRSLTEKADIDAAWKEVLAPYGVTSAKDFTHEAAAKFIAAEGPKHDPFTYPPGSSRAA